MKSRGLEAVFHEATQRHDSLALLYSQWSFDKDLIAKALQNIVSIFPHYSRHDASHSRQIIVNIERMLGERIFKLTATDMWLILESAYSHDIGMVITHKQIEDLDSQAFRDFVEDIAHDPSNDLSGFASKWLAQVLQLPQGQAAHTLLEEYKQLLAEWYRRKHPQAAEAIMCNPYEEIGLTSPRNELLPKRLFRALGAICRSHGQSFDEVMKLPFSEAGMGTEDCHPRYVACLLRMADLLDIDDNRFCPVMMRMSGVELPATSHAHHEKHQAIRHFRLDSERIKIEVACPSPESYEVAHDWFRWLEQEYHSQSQHWPKIVPSKKLGRLPTLAPPKVVLDAPYVTLSEGKRPSFEVDKDAIFALVRGTGLYKSKFDSIREVLQNAVDATLMWIWHEHEELVKAGRPDAETIKDIYGQHSIDVALHEVHGENKFRLIVRDRGVGIGRADLSRMMIVGGSSRNTEKMRKIRRMPAWFRPAGNFGIGLQSIYLLADSFRIITRSRMEDEAFKIEFKSRGGSPLVITQLQAAEVSYGSVLEVDIDASKLSSDSGFGWRGTGEPLMEGVLGFDVIRPDSNTVSFGMAKVLRLLKEFNEGSPLRLTFQGENLVREDEGGWFCAETNIVLRHIEFSEYRSSYVWRNFSFRGQSVQGPSPLVAFYQGIVDFYGEQALGFLTYNRDSIVSDEAERARSLAIKAITNYVFAHYEKMEEQWKPYAAAFMVLHGDIPCPSEFDEAVGRMPLYSIQGEVRTVGDVMDLIRSQKVTTLKFDGSLFFSEPSSEQGTLSLSSSDAVENLLKIVGTRQGLFWRTVQGGLVRNDCEWSSEDRFPVDKSVLKGIMQDRFVIGAERRMLFPCWGEYRKLALRTEGVRARTYVHVSVQNDYLMLPYVFDCGQTVQLDLNEDLLKWVYANRKYEEVSFDLLSGLYRDLVVEIQNQLF